MHWTEILHSEKQNQISRSAISEEKQVAATLYYLVDKGRMRKVSNSFGIGKSIISKIMRRILFLL